MMGGGERTPDACPRRRLGAPQGRGSVPHGRASAYRSCGPSLSSSGGHSYQSAQVYPPKQSGASPDGSSSSSGSCLSGCDSETRHSVYLNAGPVVSSSGGLGYQSPQIVGPNRGGVSSDCGNGSSDSQRSGNVSETVPFDICMSGGRCPIKLNRSLLEINREKRRELELSKSSPEIQRLRSGMVLLKNFIKHTDQVKVVEICRKLGMGTGGFYTPGYRDGAKLHLRMMCLGKNWVPDSGSYEDRRSFDGTKPPEIPEDFKKLVEDAIQASHDFLRQSGKAIGVERELPKMSPDICIVNFYNNNGRLGLHQDKDESSKSLMECLPVVSFSLGDTAEFLYGDHRDADRAERVELESGDVLIFGGKSRHVFHGVSSIKANTAPKRLTEETNLRQGRLNLTFRQY